MQAFIMDFKSSDCNYTKEVYDLHVRSLYIRESPADLKSLPGLLSYFATIFLYQFHFFFKFTGLFSGNADGYISGQGCAKCTVCIRCDTDYFRQIYQCRF